jgi:hypothetical protein
MNIKTGEIFCGYKAIEPFIKNMVEVQESEMTEKQKNEKQVSLKDHTSKLGKKLTKERKQAGLTKSALRNKRRNLRNKIKKL